MRERFRGPALRDVRGDVDHDVAEATRHLVMPEDGPLNAVAAMTQAISEFAERLALVEDEAWDRPTSCDGWTIGDLADHVIGGNAFTVAILSGADPAVAMARARDRAFAGVDDRPSAYRVSAQEMLDLVRGPEVATSTYAHIAGDVSGVALAELRTEDLALHAWDLARSIGTDERLDPRLVEFIWNSLEPRRNDLAASDLFGGGSDGSVPADAPLQTRVLDLAGRRADGI